MLSLRLILREGVEQFSSSYSLLQLSCTKQFGPKFCQSFEVLHMVSTTVCSCKWVEAAENSVT